MLEYDLNTRRVKEIKREANQEIQKDPESEYSKGIRFVLNLILTQESDEDYDKRSSIGDSSYF